jgi:hypothetical protein
LVHVNANLTAAFHAVSSFSCRYHVNFQQFHYFQATPLKLGTVPGLS